MKLLRQVKRNTLRVTTTLGEVQLGYLALDISPAIYNSIPVAAAFVGPADTGIFTPANGMGVRADPLMPGDIAAQKIASNKTKGQYNEC